MAKREITYEIWAEGYDDGEYITDYDVYVEAGKCADMCKRAFDMSCNPQSTLAELNKLQKIPANVKRIVLAVEKCHYDGFETVADDTEAEYEILL